MDRGRAHNPFSSCYVEPARGGYLFPPGQSLGGVMQILREGGWRGELVGPHGAGKSTLMYDLYYSLRDGSVPVARWFCNSERRWWPCGWWHDLRGCRVLLIDGGEALAPGLLWAVRALTRLRGQGLVITSHRRQGVGAAITVKPDENLLMKKVCTLLADATQGEDGASDIAQRVSALTRQYHGNGREVLMSLYLSVENEDWNDRMH